MTLAATPDAIAITDAKTTLAELRRDSGLTLAKIIEQATPFDDTFPQTHAGLLDIEDRGTRDYWKLSALAQVYGRNLHDLAVIAKPRKKM